MVKTHIPRIRTYKGLDQQGRYPEAAHAACEVEQDEPRWRSWYTWEDVLVAVIAPATVVVILVLLWRWV